MGTPKPLLEGEGGSFLASWLDRLAQAGVDEVRVVVAPGGRRRASALALPPEMLVENPHPDQGMLSSFLAGLAALSTPVAGAFLCPVDHPEVTVGDIESLARGFRPGRIVIPVNGGRRGHPVLFAAELFPELMSAPLELGARAVVRAEPSRVIEVPASAGVLRDVDTPEEYRAYRGVRRGPKREDPR
jgi:molybdenum cofactor cytidylyltransferase